MTVSLGDFCQLRVKRESRPSAAAGWVPSGEKGAVKIKIVVELTNGGSPRGDYVFTVNEINGETLKGTYKYTPPGSNPTDETGSFTMTHT